MLNTAKRLLYSAGFEKTEWRSLPMAMALWVARTGGDALLCSDARALAARLQSARPGVFFVPTLRLAEYGSLAQTTQTALAAIEAEYRNLFNRQLSLADQKQAAAHLLEHYRAAKTFGDRQLQQAAQDLARANAATTRAQEQLTKRSDEINSLREAFDAGVRDKQAELERKAIFSVLLGVVELAAGIALVVVSAGTAAPAAAAGAAAGAAQVTKAGADTAKQVNRLVELIKLIAKVMDAIKKIQGYYALLQSAYAAIADPIEARKRAQAAGGRIPEPLKPDETMGKAEWDEFAVALQAAFGPALDQHINGTADLLLGMQKLAIRGRDLISTQAQFERCQQRVQELLWQSLRDESDIADMHQRILKLDAQRGPGSILMAYHAQLRDRLKFRLIHAIEDMADAQRYESLSDPGVTPRIENSGAELAKLLSDLQQNLLNAKSQLGPVGDWGPEDVQTQAAGTLATLRDGGDASWVVGPENFESLDRVRVSEVRVWLQGAPVGARIKVHISTPGVYVDRLGAKRFDFSTAALDRAFHYQFDPKGRDIDAWGQPVKVTYRANDADGEFLQPTAFCTWTIDLPREWNPDLDLTALTGVALEFIGTAMPARVRSRTAPTATSAAVGARPLKHARRRVMLKKVFSL